MRRTDRYLTPAAQGLLTPSEIATLYNAAEQSPRKDRISIMIGRLAGKSAHVKRDRHSKDLHSLTIFLDGED